MFEPLTNRDLATILAALRLWQRSTDQEERAQDEIATDAGDALDDEEIDDLCEDLNCAESVYLSDSR